MLLTGDIEAGSEELLVEDFPRRLRSAVLVAPHHGSLTSSSEVFVRTVDPDYALFPAGYRNRYHFPRREVLERYQARGAALLDSARHGAIEVRLPGHGSMPEVRAWRCLHRRYWRPASCDQ
jgi:competence protein ComEC